MKLFLILRNILFTTVISPINIYRAVFNSTLPHFSQWLWLLLEMRLFKFLWPATLNQRSNLIIKFSQNDQNMDPLCLVCNSPFCESPPPSFQHHYYPIIISCYFVYSWAPVIISTNKCQKNIPTIWMSPVFS